MSLSHSQGTSWAIFHMHRYMRYAYKQTHTRGNLGSARLISSFGFAKKNMEMLERVSFDLVYTEKCVGGCLGDFFVMPILSSFF